MQKLGGEETAAAVVQEHEEWDAGTDGRVLAQGVEESDGDAAIITPQNIAVQYYRRETLRVATVVVLISLVDLFFTPIDAFILLPSSILASYWLRDSVRFGHGGDVKHCINRDCALMYFHLCSGAAIIISALDCVVLAINLSRMRNGSTVAVDIPSSATPAPIDIGASAQTSSVVATHSVVWLSFTFGLNAASFISLIYGFYCTRKLRRLLQCGTFSTNSVTAAAYV